MRAGCDLQAVTGPGATGLGVSVRLLLDALAAHATHIQLVGLRPNERDAPLRGVRDRLLWEQWRLPRRIRQAHHAAPLDVFFSPALGAPLTCPVPLVVHVHDLIPLDEPAQFHGASSWYWRSLLPATWSHARLITVSNQSLVSEVAGRLPFPAERIRVVPYYADPRMAAALAALPEHVQESPAGQPPLFLTLASHEPRKNIELAIRAVTLLRAEGLIVQLKCIGAQTHHTERLRRLAEHTGTADQVDFIGYAGTPQVAGLLASCTALLFVSRREGYGMPPQEAQSIGCPVVLSDIPSHRAVYDDPARWELVPPELRQPPPFVAPDDPMELARLMRRLIEDGTYRDSLRLAGRAYQATFSAEATARALATVLAEAAG
jgi:glycosyltransferase involved in cell wall biosynthesis